MYAHQVIEDFKKSKEHFESLGFGKNALDRLTNTVSGCMMFNIDDIDGLIDNFSKPCFIESPYINGYKRYLKLPFDRCWIDWSGSNKRHEYNNVVASAAIVVESHGMIMVDFFKKLSGYMFAPSISTWIFSLSGNFNEEQVDEIIKNIGNGETSRNELLSMKHLGYTHQKDEMISKYGIEQTDDLLSKERQAMIRINLILQSFMLLLNCKNISTKKNYPPEALNKKRIKQGKQPLFTYHTLVINPISEKRRNDGPHEATGIKQRLHFCRGHFKEYTDSNKLFGKYTGMYWWQPMVRGNKELGIVHKNYQIKAA